MTKSSRFGRRKFLLQSSLALGAVAAPALLRPRAASAATSSIVLAGWGGEPMRRLREAVSKPFTGETGIAVKEVTAVTTMVSQIKAQVDNGNPEWDVACLTGPEAYQLANNGYLAALVYEPQIKQDVPKELLDTYCAAEYYASFVVGWNPEVFPATHEPRTWADLWNVKEFPGRRTACGWFPYYMVEIALMADGVPKEQVYPMTAEKIAHGFNKIRELRSHINVWWSSGAQSAQLFADKEVDLGMVYAARLREVIKSGHQAKWSFAQPLMEAQWLGIPKGSQNIEAATKWVNVSLTKESQVQMMRMNGLPPTNPKAFDLVTPEEKASGLGDAESVKNGLLLDSNFWSMEYPKYMETWETIKSS